MITLLMLMLLQPIRPVAPAVSNVDLTSVIDWNGGETWDQVLQTLNKTGNVVIDSRAARGQSTAVPTLQIKAGRQTFWIALDDVCAQAKLQWMRSFIDRELVPLEPVMRELPRAEWSVVKAHLQAQVKDQGLWGAFLDPKLGGPGFGQLKLALMSEIIGRCMFSMTIFGVQAPDSGNMELLAHGATEAQKERWLWPNLRGEISSAFALTEPFHAGADPTVIGTTASRDGGEWVINGHKWFITNASVADIVLVFAETNPESRPHKHASIIVVPSGTPGMEIVRDISTMAHPDTVYGRTGNHAEIIFRDCRVPADHLIGAPGAGFVLAQQRLGGGRIHHAMRWLGQAQRSLEIMCERAVSRTSHGKLLGCSFTLLFRHLVSVAAPND